MSDEPKMDFTPGKFSWNELCTTDLEGAKTFYGKVFGWTFESAPPPNETYQMAASKGQAVAGLMTMPPDAPAGMPPAWGAYITVENCDATVEAATAAGGTVIMPSTDIPNVGRMAFFSDPQGACIGIMQYDPSCAG